MKGKKILLTTLFFSYTLVSFAQGVSNQDFEDFISGVGVSKTTLEAQDKTDTSTESASKTSTTTPTTTQPVARTTSSDGSLKEKYTSDAELKSDIDRYLDSASLDPSSEVKSYNVFSDSDVSSRGFATQRLSISSSEQEDKKSFLDSLYLAFDTVDGWFAKLIKYLYMTVSTYDAVNNVLETVETIGDNTKSLKETMAKKKTEKIKEAHGEGNLEDFSVDSPDKAVEDPSASTSKVVSDEEKSDAAKVSKAVEENVLVAQPKDSVAARQVADVKTKFVQDNMIDMGAKMLFLKSRLERLTKSMDKLRKKAAKDTDKDKAFRINYEAKELYNEMLLVVQEIASLRLQMLAIQNIKTLETLPQPILSTTEGE
ncbi:MAG: hypothetical protein EOM53_01325 [Alphaproteobacteria bacterium]|nr:hypothetical protein [Alphaproteobacteria bacterium]